MNTGTAPADMRLRIAACGVVCAAVAVLGLPVSAQRLSTDSLRAVNRAVTPLAGDRAGVHVSEGPGPGVAWVEGSDFAEGTLEIDLRGRDLQGQSFLGLAFHRQDDTAYEAAYLRPFNFRASNATSHGHAIQYMTVPAYDWPRLRQDFPEEFENPVDASIDPIDWVHLRLVVRGGTVQIFVGPSGTPALEVRKLGTLTRGAVGLWVGNASDGDFANLRIAP